MGSWNLKLYFSWKIDVLPYQKTSSLTWPWILNSVLNPWMKVNYAVGQDLRVVQLLVPNQNPFWFKSSPTRRDGTCSINGCFGITWFESCIMNPMVVLYFVVLLFNLKLTMSSISQMDLCRSNWSLSVEKNFYEPVNVWRASSIGQKNYYLCWY